MDIYDAWSNSCKEAKVEIDLDDVIKVLKKCNIEYNDATRSIFNKMIRETNGDDIFDSKTFTEAIYDLFTEDSIYADERVFIIRSQSRTNSIMIGCLPSNMELKVKGDE